MVFWCVFGFVSKPRTGPPNPTIINLNKNPTNKKHRALQPSELQSINAYTFASSFSAEARELEDPTCTNSRMWSSSKGSTPIWCSPLPGGVKGSLVCRLFGWGWGRNSGNNGDFFLGGVGWEYVFFFKEKVDGKIFETFQFPFFLKGQFCAVKIGWSVRSVGNVAPTTSNAICSGVGLV